MGLPWYRALPWAGVAAVQVTFDGRPVDVLSIDGGPVAATQRQDYWSLQHRAELHLGEEAPSGRTTVALHVDLRIPGPTKPDGSPMDYRFETQRELVADI
ncbi:hypothetical protein DDQ50_04380 [Amnibacterium flavum]|uniref:Uncharacterized protein n=1 Tax=Amnibacterium flavum TaxID=2173173 RepID=A0A2V1HT20_9MICO|nr:hypothetical protein DDQ50_04380 [Amnibacterium flavum]